MNFLILIKPFILKKYDEIDKLIKKDKNITKTFKINKISTRKDCKKNNGSISLYLFSSKKRMVRNKKK